MSFTGKATYCAGTSLPETAEDVSDVIGIISPYEIPFLDVIGDPLRATTSTHHEWLEDTLLPNKDVIAQCSELNELSFGVANPDRFMAGDQIQIEGSAELMLVTNVASDGVTVVRGYAGTNTENLADGQIINILGNAAIEGGNKPTARFTKRTRHGNHTQIFTKPVEVSLSSTEANQLGLSDEMDYQSQERLRELLRDLENTVINGSNKEDGSGMKGIIEQLEATDAKGKVLNQTILDAAMKKVWENSDGNVNLIVVGGYQKRQMNSFLTNAHSTSHNTYSDMVSVYESDFGVCRIVTSRWVPQGVALLLDSTRINVLPLAGRSFHFKPLASGSDYECGELIGEYTLELKNEATHGLIRGLSTE